MAHKSLTDVSNIVRRADTEIFEQDGFIVINRPVFSDVELNEVHTIMDGLRNHLAEVPSEFYVDLAGGKGATKKIDEILWASRLEPKLKRTKVFLRTRQIAEILLGGPVTLHFDHHIQKAPFSDNGTQWHQDQGFEADTGVKGTFWIPLVDVDTTNGCMWYIPGSHKRGLLEHDRVGVAAVEAKGFDATTERAGPLSRGGLNVHRELTLHSSKPNTTGNSRPAWILRFRRDEMSAVRLKIKEVRSGTSSAPGLSRVTRVKHK